MVGVADPQIRCGYVQKSAKVRRHDDESLDDIAEMQGEKRKHVQNDERKAVDRRKKGECCQRRCFVCTFFGCGSFFSGVRLPGTAFLCPVSQRVCFERSEFRTPRRQLAIIQSIQRDSEDREARSMSLSGLRDREKEQLPFSDHLLNCLPFITSGCKVRAVCHDRRRVLCRGRVLRRSRQCFTASNASLDAHAVQFLAYSLALLFLIASSGLVASRSLSKTATAVDQQGVDYFAVLVPLWAAQWLQLAASGLPGYSVANKNGLSFRWTHCMDVVCMKRASPFRICFQGFFSIFSFHCTELTETSFIRSLQDFGSYHDDETHSCLQRYSTNPQHLMVSGEIRAP